MEEMKKCCIKVLNKLLTDDALNWNFNNNWLCTCGHDLRWFRNVLVDVGYKTREEAVAGIPHMTTWKEQFIWLNEEHQKLKSQLTDKDESHKIDLLEKDNDIKNLELQLKCRRFEIEKIEKEYCACGFPQSYPIPHEHDWSDREKTIIRHFEFKLADQKKEIEAVNFSRKELFMTIHNALRDRCLMIEDLFPDTYRGNGLWQDANKLWKKVATWELEGLPKTDLEWLERINNLDEMVIKRRVFFESYLKEWYKEHNVPEDLQIYISDLINTNIHHTIKVTKKLLGDKKKSNVIVSTFGKLRSGMSIPALHMSSQREGWFEFLKSIEWGVTASCNAKWKNRIKQVFQKELENAKCFKDHSKDRGFWCGYCYGEQLVRHLKKSLLKNGSSKEDDFHQCGCVNDGCKGCLTPTEKPSRKPIEKWTVRRIYNNFILHHQVHPNLMEAEEFVKIDDLRKSIDEVFDEINNYKWVELGCDKCYAEYHTKIPYVCPCECHKRQRLKVAKKLLKQKIFSSEKDNHR